MRSDPSLTKTGSIAAFGVACAYFASGIAAVLMPAELQGRSDITQHQFWTVLSSRPAAHLAYHWSFVVAGLCGLAAVPLISLLVWPLQRGAVLWSGLAATYGCAVLARSHLMEIAFDRKIIPAYAHADPAFQQAVHVVAGLALDVPDGILTYGAIGVWVILVSWLARRDASLPPLLSWIGLAAGFTLLAGMAGYTFRIRELLVVSIGLGGFLLVPAWFAWLGMILRRQAAQASSLSRLSQQ